MRKLIYFLPSTNFENKKNDYLFIFVSKLFGIVKFYWYICTRFENKIFNNFKI